MRARALVAPLLALSLCPLAFPAGAQSRFEALQDKALKLRLKELTQGKDPAVRAEAAHALGDLHDGEPEVVTALATALASDREARVREAAASALWELHESAAPAESALRAALGDPAPAVRVRAAGALEAMGVEAAELVAVRRSVLAEGDLDARFLAARGLIEFDPPASLAGTLLEYARAQAEPASDWEVRDAREHNLELAERALERLARTQDRATLPALVAAVAASHPVNLVVLPALDLFDPKPDGWVDLLLRQASFPDAEIRREAASLLGDRTENAEEVARWAPALGRLTGDPDRWVRSAALSALGNAGGLAHEALPGVLAVLRSDPEADLRESAAETVGEIGEREQAVPTSVKAAVAEGALPALQRAIAEDAEEDVRTEALRSLNRLALAPEAVVPILAQVATGSGDQALVEVALRALRNRGPEAAAATPLVAPLAEDAREGVRIEARAALESMGSDRTLGATLRPAPTDAAAEQRGLALLRSRGVELSETGYYVALHQGDVELVGAFLDAGMSADHRFKSSYGEPTLRVVLWSDGCHPALRPTPDNYKAVVRLLLDRGADANATDERGNTPLMAAAEECDPDVVKTLLAAGADPHAVNGSGLNAFEFTLWYGADGAIPLLEAGFRLSADKAAMYREAYKDNPKALELVRRASPR